MTWGDALTVMLCFVLAGLVWALLVSLLVECLLRS